jgi:hypothetical protein
MDHSTLNAAAIKHLPIIWHPTTPRNFECQPGCVCCCTATLFFQSEADKCPAEMQAGLEWRQGFLRARRRPPGVCVFFDENTPQHCQVFEHRPLRCRLYPYLPLITDEGIVIVADPFCTVSFPETDFPDWYRCYGLGCGPNVQPSIEQMSREFLGQVLEEYPQLLDTLCVAEVDGYLNSKELEKNLHPRYRQWMQGQASAREGNDKGICARLY